MAEIDSSKIEKYWDNIEKVEDPETFISGLDSCDKLYAFYRRLSEPRHLFSKIKITPDMDILDVGTGTGRWAMDLAIRGKHVTATDISQKVLDIAKQKSQDMGIKNIEFLKGSCHELPDGKQFDIIHVGGVLTYLNDQEIKIFAEGCKKILRKGGRLILRESVSLSGERFFISSKKYEGNIPEYEALYRTPHELKLFFNDFHLEYENYTFPVNLPVSLYRKLPRSIADSRFIQDLFKLMLRGWVLIEPLLLSIPSLQIGRLKRALKFSDKVTYQFFFIYEYR